MYVPRPIDSAEALLPESLTALVEQLAESTHDTWAQRRLAEGWTWGPTRDDRAKTHPDLVPYAQLTESEKEYDRSTALGTLKAISVLGYRIEPAS
jgi:ryanodine receptor 2